MEVKHVPASERENYKQFPNGHWYVKTKPFDYWVDTNRNIVFDYEEEKEDLVKRTISAIECLLKVAPEHDESCDDGDGHTDTWASDEWDEARTRLRKIMNEWKEMDE